VPTPPPNWRKVKSSSTSAAKAVYQHERAKDYLPPGEMAKQLMTYRHGLRVSEAVGRRRDETGSRPRPAMSAPAQRGPVRQTTDRRRRVVRDQAIPRDPHHRTALAVHLRTRPAACSPGGQLPDRRSNQSDNNIRAASWEKYVSSTGNLGSTPFDPADATPICDPPPIFCKRFCNEAYPAGLIRLLRSTGDELL
jgi:hypothetical protein